MFLLPHCCKSYSYIHTPPESQSKRADDWEVIIHLSQYHLADIWCALLSVSISVFAFLLILTLYKFCFIVWENPWGIKYLNTYTLNTYTIRRLGRVSHLNTFWILTRVSTLSSTHCQVPEVGNTCLWFMYSSIRHCLI